MENCHEIGTNSIKKIAIQCFVGRFSGRATSSWVPRARSPHPEDRASSTCESEFCRFGFSRVHTIFQHCHIQKFFQILFVAAKLRPHAVASDRVESSPAGDGTDDVSGRETGNAPHQRGTGIFPFCRPRHSDRPRLEVIVVQDRRQFSRPARRRLFVAFPRRRAARQKSARL